MRISILVKITDISNPGRNFELCRNFWCRKIVQVRSDRVKEHFLFLLFYDISQIEKNRSPATPPRIAYMGGIVILPVHKFGNVSGGLRNSTSKRRFCASPWNSNLDPHTHSGSFPRIINRIVWCETVIVFQALQKKESILWISRSVTWRFRKRKFVKIFR